VPVTPGSGQPVQLVGLAGCRGQAAGIDEVPIARAEVSRLERHLAPG
jgi:hypothetical protein